MDTWGFIGLMVALCLVILFLLFVILRKYSKSESRTEDVSAVTRENSQVSEFSNLIYNIFIICLLYIFKWKNKEIKTVSHEDITCWDKIGFRSSEALRTAFEWWAKKVVCRFPKLWILFSLAWSSALIVGFKGEFLILKKKNLNYLLSY